MSSKSIISVNGPVVKARGEADFKMHDMVHVGDEELLGEVIKLKQDTAIIQVYEETYGLKIGEKVTGTDQSLSMILAPGIVGNIFDGIGRPLNILYDKTGDFIKRGSNLPSIDLEKKWHFHPKVSLDEQIHFGSIIGEVKETESITNRIMNPHLKKGRITYIAAEGDYTVCDVIAKYQDEEDQEQEIKMMQEWPVRIPRQYKERKITDTPLLTGQRIIDTMFPITKGGTAMLPGGFGTGKTMLQHQIAKWCDADLIVYIGCGERGNEMTSVLEEFPELIDPKTQRPLMERTVLIANTSNMPVAAREASIYTGITIAEYYRDMGYHIAIMADSTSRWAEALREISGRLEEMPAEEGFPSYLPSRLSEFYGRAGMVETNNGKLGSVSVIGAVSPQGADFSEPVTQNTKRFVHVFWGLNRNLAYSRHYPAVDWNVSYSEYIQNLKDWYEENVDEKFMSHRQKIVKLLEEEKELLEIAKVVGQDVLSDSKKLVLETCRAIRIGFLQQSAMSEIDTSVPIQKQFLMMDTILYLHAESLKLIEKGIPLSIIKEKMLFGEYMKMKLIVRNDAEEEYKIFKDKIKNHLREIEKQYQEHIKA